MFDEKGLVHRTPPANRKPLMIADLFNWLRTAKRQIILILYSNPSSSDKDVVERSSPSLRSVEKQLKHLKDLGIISRHGSGKTGL